MVVIIMILIIIITQLMLLSLHINHTLKLLTCKTTILISFVRRLTDLLKQTKGKVMVGGMSDVNDKYFAPTVVFDVDEEDILMQDEVRFIIF